MKNKLTILIFILVLGTLLSACGATTVYTQSEPPMRTITVTGTGAVTLTPDIAYVYIGVQTQDASASIAMDNNTARAQAVIEAIKTFGVADKDIQTSNFSISPQPIYDDSYNITGYTYMVQNTVYVTVRDLDKLGSLLDAAFEAGANTINSISFDVADRTEAVSQARLAAVENARRQADELATASGVSVGDVQTISYYDSTPIVNQYMEVRAMADSAGSVPIESGSMEISTTVTIVYAIR
jgi:uncharacterized protein YggE